jgi:hypothetical protein
MSNSSLYNGQNLDFTGNKNPYGLIQNAGKRKKSKRSRTKRSLSKKSLSNKRNTRKYRR